jgi:hypothetical protein
VSISSHKPQMHIALSVPTEQATPESGLGRKPLHKEGHLFQTAPLEGPEEKEPLMPRPRSR